MSCGRGPDCPSNPGNCCCSGPGRTFFDMIHDPCAKTRWNDCKAKIYGRGQCGPTSFGWPTNVSPCCRFPPKRCPPPPPPPRSCCSCHRCNPARACGFIVKRSNYPGGRPQCCPSDEGCPCDCCCGAGSGGHYSTCGPMAGFCPRVPGLNCSRPPKCCPIPDPCPGCCASSCSVYCRPAWRHNALKPNPWCHDPPALPPRSFRYKCWVSQFQGKLDSNLCASKYSSLVDRSGCNMVITDPPECGPCPPCPCHSCCE